MSRWSQLTLIRRVPATTELLWRQIHPSWLSDGHVTSQAFRPNSGDAARDNRRHPGGDSLRTHDSMTKALTPHGENSTTQRNVTSPY